MKRTRTTQTTQEIQPLKSARTSKKARSRFGIPRSLRLPTNSGFPKQLKIRHRYHTTVTSTSVAGAPAVYLFSCNGLFDPDISSTGHQPMYFDQVAALYNHYNVISSKITVKFAPGSATVNVIGIYIEDDTTVTPTSADAMCEQPSGVSSLLLAGAGPSEVVTLTKKWSAQSAFGASPLQNDNLQGSSGANPSEQQYFTIFQADSQLTNASTVIFSVMLEYDAIWDELKNLTQS